MKQWTEDDKARLAMLLRAGRSAGQIAPLFKRSRNAIISMVNRDKSLKAIGFKGQGVRA